MGQLLERPHQIGQGIRVVDVGRPVQCHHRVVAGLEVPCSGGVQFLGAGQRVHQGVDHYVADAVDALGGHPLGSEVLVRVRRRCEQQVGQPVGDDAVYLLRHAPVPASESGLHVADPDSQLRGNECRGDRGVHVTEHQDQIRFHLQAHGLE